MINKTTTHNDIDSLNQNILAIDLNDLEAEALEQRIELTVASVFDTEVWDNGLPPGGDEPCGQFSCTGYFTAS